MRYARGSNKDCIRRLMGRWDWPIAATQAWKQWKIIEILKHFSRNVISWWTTWSPIRRPESLAHHFLKYPSIYPVLRWYLEKSWIHIWSQQHPSKFIFEKILFGLLDSISTMQTFTILGMDETDSRLIWQERERRFVSILTRLYRVCSKYGAPLSSVSSSCKMAEKICVFVSSILSSLVIVNILVFYTNKAWKLRREPSSTFFTPLDENSLLFKKCFSLPWTIYITMTLNRASLRVETNAVSCLIRSSWRFSYNPATFLLRNCKLPRTTKVNVRTTWEKFGIISGEEREMELCFSKLSLPQFSSI